MPPPDNDTVPRLDCENNQGEHLNDNILRKVGWLHGFRIDDTQGPRVSALPIASYVEGAEPFIEEMNQSSTEIITTHTKREANYTHRGWPASAFAIMSPWTSSRIAARNQPDPEGKWYTRFTRATRLKVEVLLEDLVPVPEFSAAIEGGLRQLTTFARFQAIYRALGRWGDVIPLEIEIGSSLALTDTEVDRLQFPETGERNYNCIAGLSTIKTAAVAVTGAGLGWSDGEWTAKDDPQWRIIKVDKLVPTISLLSSELQTQLSELYAQRLSYVPRNGLGLLRNQHKMYDDNQHTLRTLTSVTTRFSDYIELLTAAYSDGTTSSKHGGGGHVGAEHNFTLATAEHIIEMLIWTQGGYIRGLQLITSMGRCSPQYGAQDGTVTVARTRCGVLVGFLIHTQSHPQHGQMYTAIQGIWRHDILPRVPKEDDVYSEYFGNGNGNAFNDRELIGNSHSIRISSIEINAGDCIDSIQFTYTDSKDWNELKLAAPRHGGSGGSPHRFVLQDDEHIVTASGRHEEQRITQLCFGTSRGRTSEVYGAGKGQAFSSLAPREDNGNYFRLQYICGKSNGNSLTGIMFVWTPC